jgi:hypothetical protein
VYAPQVFRVYAPQVFRVYAPQVFPSIQDRRSNLHHIAEVDIPSQQNCARSSAGGGNLCEIGNTTYTQKTTSWAVVFHTPVAT